MNFILWLLARIKKTLIGDGPWEWISEYRRLILREKPFSILLTFLGGLLWFLACGLLTVWLVEDKQIGGHIMQGVIISIPAFYIYNWLAALYEVYDAERMATWHTLQDRDC